MLLLLEHLQCMYFRRSRFDNISDGFTPLLVKCFCFCVVFQQLHCYFSNKSNIKLLLIYFGVGMSNNKKVREKIRMCVTFFILAFVHTIIKCFGLEFDFKAIFCFRYWKTLDFITKSMHAKKKLTTLILYGKFGAFF